MRDLVAIDGSGVAACCCARLLQSAGVDVSASIGVRGDGPVLLLSEQTQKLLIDVFGNASLFNNAIPIRRRIVLWGSATETAVLPHSGVVIAETDLLAKLWSLVSVAQPNDTDEPDWRIISARKSAASESHDFGTRIANASKVHLKSDAPADACWVESLDAGWLFLLPCGNGIGSLISVGDAPATLLGESRLIARQVDQLTTSGRTFPAYPRAITPFCEPGWISCGTAALGFDPICGEGAGNAVREAILASAVIGGAARGLNVTELLSLYSSRLMGGFSRHLSICLDYYRSAARSDWWQSEISYLREGLRWSQQTAEMPPLGQYQLTGFELRKVS